MRRGRAALLTLALVCVGCAEGPLPAVPTPAEVHANARARDIFDALRPLVGNTPLECNSNLRGGQVTRVWRATPDALAQWFVCAEAARAARRPFLVVLEHPPFEGWQLTGILGGLDGTTRAFRYYEGCCAPSTPSLSAGVCESPTARSDRGGFYGLRCANEDTSGFVPTPELWLRAFPLPPDLADRLRAMTGDGVVDCGLEVNLLLEPSSFSSYFLHPAFACTETALASGWPFQLLLRQRSGHSTIVTGLIGTSAGAVSRFNYDSAPCGGPGCASAFEVRPCARPALVESGDTADVVCEPASTLPEPPSRRRRAP